MNLGTSHIESEWS